MKLLRVLCVLTAGLVPGLGGRGATPPPVIALPPFLVEETAHPLPWRYAEVGGWEVLSTCRDRLTRELMANHLRLHLLLDELVPPTLQWRTSERQTLLFVDSAHQPPSSQEVVAAMALTAAELDRLGDLGAPPDDGRLRRRPPPPRYTFLPNLRLWDRDTGALFVLVREADFDPAQIALSPDYIAHLLRNRLPALPAWFVSGVLTLPVRFSDQALILDPLDWPLASGSAALSSGPEANRALLPLADFFAGELASADAERAEALALWQAQAALFVRWGVEGGGAPRRPALERFVTRAATEPVTEALFRECFGLDYAAAHRELTAYLLEAMRESLVLRPRVTLRPPDFALRPASDLEVARIKGDWERLEVGFVRLHWPFLAEKYLTQSRRTLMRAYERGHREPRLLAAIGLCEIEDGNDDAARRFLEDAATRGSGLRARAWFELARLRLAALAGPSPAGGARLTPEQAGTVLTPLAAARELQPPLPEVYELIAEVWAVCSEPPTRAQLAVLEAGVRLFPHRGELVYRTAELSLRHDYTDAARWLIELGRTLAPDATARARFEALSSRINAER